MLCSKNDHIFKYNTKYTFQSYKIGISNHSLFLAYLRRLGALEPWLTAVRGQPWKTLGGKVNLARY